ncbi:hypothetical protein BCV72DRAFT_253408 [Rhizopus microsporus var. microsporus]|uniref:Uncharacterized protein n=1 Tax=Rhizopus microsporus var. microsporus TaxID=86635 RepID=A0A1X0QM28_RHIZD|nr:hypothetical protein BCV72DRAFT_253408 [Rhizopus microsporus var. microsporus]
MRYACSRLLAGIILLNTSTGKSVIVNSVESFRMKKEAPISYSDVNGIKLIFGTKIFNALVTSSLRIDIDIKSEIGPVTSNFILNAYERSFATKIFSAQYIAKCERTNKISNNGNNGFGYRVGSLLLQTIASNMITGRGVLCKDVVDLLKSKIPRGINMDKCNNKIITLFNNDDSIVIIDNTELNHMLQKIARSLAPQIAKANESIAVTVKSIFSS